MRQLIVLKVGSTLPSLASKRGDFEDWILAGMKVAKETAAVVDVRCGAPLPGYGQVAGIVITGSHAMVTERQAWSERTAQWLPEAVARGIPILGICYGHQLLAYAMGGEVGDNSHGREYGTVDVCLEAAASEDPLLQGLPTSIQAHTGHTQTILRLPEAARRLAFSRKDRNQAFVIGACAWGIQFHPEFDAEITRAYIHHMWETLQAEGQDPKELLAVIQEAETGSEILIRFAALIVPNLQPKRSA
jgi:GMP synthase (glutamine-hydrolysing)